MSGRALAEHIASCCPATRVLFMSGYTDESIERLGDLGAGFVRKPFDAKTLVANIRRALDQPR
jgi:FixJ family two-component response regulator